MLFKKLGADCVAITRPALFAFIFLFHWKKTKVILSLEKNESYFVTGKKRKFILSDFRSSVLFDTPSLEVIKREKGSDSV